MYKILLKLLAPQSGAHGRGAFRDFQPNPVPLLSLDTYMYVHIQKHLSQSVAVCGTTRVLDHYYILDYY